MPSDAKLYRNVVNSNVKKQLLRGSCFDMFHGGKSTGPVTSLGRKRCADAKTIHGRETRTIRIKHSQKLRELKFLFEFIK